ncbi:MAG: hypothetical protein JNN00_03635 [Chitinophagaceae bacterium]|nr:hypothetical protein [Chitinophagaceae bacterium]
MKKILLLIITGSVMMLNAAAQDSLQTTEPEAAPAKAKQKFTKATFRSTRIINMQSVEVISKNTLQFMISHHFGYLWNKDLGGETGEVINQRTRQNIAQLFGLNSGVANTYLSLDYSPLSWANVGVAATGAMGFEGWLKFKLLRQQTGVRNIPVTVGLFSLMNVDASIEKYEGEFDYNRVNYMHQLLIARKFSDKLSLQLMPTMVHFNLVPYGINNSNYVYSIGLGGKYKVRRNINVTFEYARQLNMYENLMDKNGNIYQYTPDLLAFGLEFDTGGHLFQLYVSSNNSASNIDQLARNTSDGKYCIGFTINRGFNLKK